ncbi:MAG: ABC transporter substrate-binding protein [Pseudomonadota bacterium]
MKGSLKAVPWAAVVLLLAAASVLPGCGRTPAPKVFKVAVLTTSREPLAKASEMLRLGARLRADQVNAAGGINGTRLELLFVDTGGRPRTMKLALERLVADENVALILGPLCSGEARAIEPILAASGLPALLPAASAEYLAHSSPVMFRMAPSDGRQARLLALYTSREMGIRRAALIYEDSGFGRAVRTAFSQQAKRNGLRIVAERPYPGSGPEIENTLREVAASGPEAVLLAGDTEMGVVMAKTAARLGLGLRFLATSLMAERLLLDLGGTDVEGFTLAEPGVFQPEEPEAKEFLEKFQDAYRRRPTWLAATAYDAVGLAAEALAKTGGSRTAIRHELGAMGLATRGYQGVTGLIFFDAWGGNQRPVRIMRVENGAFVPATAQFSQKHRGGS